jgi:hypothetical protein
VKANSIHSDVRSKPLIRVRNPSASFWQLSTLRLERHSTYSGQVSTSSPYCVGNKDLIENVANFIINTTPRRFLFKKFMSSYLILSFCSLHKLICFISVKQWCTHVPQPQWVEVFTSTLLYAFMAPSHICVNLRLLLWYRLPGLCYVGLLIIRMHAVT